MSWRCAAWMALACSESLHRCRCTDLLACMQTGWMLPQVRLTSLANLLLLQHPGRAARLI